MKAIPEILREEVKKSPDFIKPLMPFVVKALQTRVVGSFRERKLETCRYNFRGTS